MSVCIFYRCNEDIIQFSDRLSQFSEAGMPLRGLPWLSLSDSLSEHARHCSRVVLVHLRCVPGLPMRGICGSGGSRLMVGVAGRVTGSGGIGIAASACCV
jgi:hypothetical protein